MYISNSMTNKKTFTIALLMGLWLLLGTSEAQSNQDCCLSYNKIPRHLPRRAIKGFIEQSSSEVCDIDAIIFHMKGGLKACANPEDPWVKRHLRWLSEKLKKLSQ
ncbi:hypothetical protein lerEdw1_008155 [Lerista edwardsae]|nr:hypothetical protein lerEdw1_008155 [Lerista edwardsae]